MLPWSNFPNGITSRGIPIPFGIVGDIYFVDSNNGNDGNRGVEMEHPLATVDKAIEKATADNCDLIVLLPGHAETLSAATIFQIDKAGITIVGIGTGTRIPTFTSSVAAGALNIDSDNTVVKNIRLTAGYTGGSTQAVDIATGLSGIVLDGVECRDTSNTKEWLIHVSFAGTSTGTLIKNCSFVGIAGGSMTNSILEAGIQTDLVITGNYIFVDSSDDVIDLLTSVHVNAKVDNNIIINADTDSAGYCLRFNNTATGVAHDNRMGYNKNNAEMTYGGGVFWFQNYVSNTIAESGLLDPATSHAIP